MVAYAVRCRFFSHDCMFCKGVRGSSDLSGKAAAASPASQQSDDQVHAAPRPLTVRVRHDGTGPGPDTEVFEALRAPRANALQPRPLLNTHVDNDDDDARSKGASGGTSEQAHETSAADHARRSRPCSAQQTMLGAADHARRSGPCSAQWTMLGAVDSLNASESAQPSAVGLGAFCFFCSLGVRFRARSVAWRLVCVLSFR
jgi:hypothetical protein